MIILGQRAIFDVPTAAIGAASLVVLWRFKLHEPIVVAAAGPLGLALWLVVRGGTARRGEQSGAAMRWRCERHVY